MCVILCLCWNSLLKTYKTSKEFLAQNLLSINCLLVTLLLCFIDFWFSSYRTRDLEVEVAHTIKGSFGYYFG